MIDQVIANYCARGYSRSTTHLYAQQLRRFFRFAEQRSWCKPGLADGIMPPQRYPGETIRKDWTGTRLFACSPPRRAIAFLTYALAQS
jgi:hypothetical protein